MTSDPPRRWADDSPEEDAEVHRQQELARLERWMGEQKTRPIRDLLGEPSGQGYAGALILPDWWDRHTRTARPVPAGASGPESPRPALNAARPASRPVTRPSRGPGGQPWPRRFGGWTSPGPTGSTPGPAGA